MIIRAIVLFALVWIGLLMSGYGILVGSKVNAAGLGLQCHYLTARGTSTAQYLHTNSGIIGFYFYDFIPPDVIKKAATFFVAAFF